MCGPIRCAIWRFEKARELIMCRCHSGLCGCVFLGRTIRQSGGYAAFVHHDRRRAVRSSVHSICPEYPPKCSVAPRRREAAGRHAPSAPAPAAWPIFAAIRRASSLLSSLAAERRPSLVLRPVTRLSRAARSCQARRRFAWRTARKRCIMRVVVDPRGRECRLKHTSS